MSLKESKDQIRRVIFSRRSIRVFKKRAVSLNRVLKVLSYGVWAPSAHNCQPWRFIIVVNQEVKRTLTEKMAALYESDMRKDGLPEKEVEKRLLKSKAMLLTSPVLILVCLDKNALWSYKDTDRVENEFIMGVQSVAAAVQNILLGAHIEGLGACWMCAPLFCRKLIRDSLFLPEEYTPQAFIVMGYPAEQPSPPPRMEITRLITVIDKPLK
ncbi:MAG: nitroreductase family protein [Candidatus Odinarchaeota archaeon]